MQIVPGVEMLYINRYFEVNLTASTNTSYYYLGERLIAMSANATLRYIHQDHLTGTSIVTSDNGSLVESLKYYSYGETRSFTGTDVTDKKYTGQRLDGTGLYYYGARYYDPTIGRFISPDTIVPSPANPQSFNRYSYCLNNPLKYTDPSGHLVYDENGNPIDTSDPYWIENLAFSGNMLVEEILEDVLTPTTAAWCDFVWSGIENYITAHTLERDQKNIVNLKYGDLGPIMKSAIEENGNVFTITLNNNIYRNMMKADAPFRSKAILDQVYKLPNYFPLSEGEIKLFWNIPNIAMGITKTAVGTVFMASGVTIAIGGSVSTGFWGTAFTVGTGSLITAWGWNLYASGINQGSLGYFDLPTIPGLPTFPFGAYR
jgi:RHS repeat-associated protein